ncbi:uncharacterized protein A4U43_UnF2930 [Asparagus officinalis]|uniref:ATP synthase mitochondrial F1 complex assembly factor 2 n=1 Tax=Asparagus officinalis TaxID=4686 RepID=A0A1R3L7A2_ASPOF|nr:uncharacterized protein A4U43_UnF2930 [Asparagus officinalis]
MSFTTGSVIGKRFYKEVTTRLADDGNGWTVMLDYRTLKTKLPTLALAKAIAAEWEYQEKDGIRPFTMPLMKLACTALERVPLTRVKVIENLMNKFHQDLVFCRTPGDTEITEGVLEKQKEKIDPILDWVQSEFGYKPQVHYSLFGTKQEEGLVKAVEDCLKKTNDCELAAIDAMTAAAHSLVIPLGIFRGKLGIEEAIELIRLEEDLQVDGWGLVEANSKLTRSSSPSPAPLVTEEEGDSPALSSSPPAAAVGCRTCGREEIEKGCNGEGRIQGGIATVPGFGWWPIKAYRPCPGFTASGGRYRRRGQSMDEVASGRKRDVSSKSSEGEGGSKSSKKREKK